MINPAMAAAVTSSLVLAFAAFTLARNSSTVRPVLGLRLAAEEAICSAHCLPLRMAPSMEAKYRCNNAQCHHCVSMSLMFVYVSVLFIQQRYRQYCLLRMAPSMEARYICKANHRPLLSLL
jgi:hypothetical protein